MKMNLCGNCSCEAHLTSIFSIFVILALINSKNSRDRSHLFRRKWTYSQIKKPKSFLFMIQCSLFALKGLVKLYESTKVLRIP